MHILQDDLGKKGIYFKTHVHSSGSTSKLGRADNSSACPLISRGRVELTRTTS